jgi:hypothetical protein
MREALPKRLLDASASSTELVLPFIEALEALDLLQRSGAAVLGWEGWLRYPDGRKGHSQAHQGTADIAGEKRLAPYLLCRETMQKAHSKHSASPEQPGAELLFCITYAA